MNENQKEALETLKTMYAKHDEGYTIFNIIWHMVEWGEDGADISRTEEEEVLRKFIKELDEKDKGGK